MVHARIVLRTAKQRIVPEQRRYAGAGDGRRGVGRAGGGVHIILVSILRSYAVVAELLRANRQISHMLEYRRAVLLAIYGESVNLAIGLQTTGKKRIVEPRKELRIVCIGRLICLVIHQRIDGFGIILSFDDPDIVELVRPIRHNGRDIPRLPFCVDRSCQRAFGLHAVRRIKRRRRIHRRGWIQRRRRVLVDMEIPCVLRHDKHIGFSAVCLHGNVEQRVPVVLNEEIHAVLRDIQRFTANRHAGNRVQVGAVIYRAADHNGKWILQRHRLSVRFVPGHIIAKRWQLQVLSSEHVCRVGIVACRNAVDVHAVRQCNFNSVRVCKRASNSRALQHAHVIGYREAAPRRSHFDAVLRLHGAHHTIRVAGKEPVVTHLNFARAIDLSGIENINVPRGGDGLDSPLHPLHGIALRLRVVRGECIRLVCDR